MNIKHILNIFFILLLLSACEKTTGIAEVNGVSISESEFDSYLKIKNIPAQNEQQRKKALEKYTDRIGLASAIESQEGLDKQAINVEVEEFKKELLISRYFDDFLKDKVTEQAILNYYNSHPDEYQENRIRPAHILIRTNKAMDDVERQAKWTLAQEVYSKARAGEAFTELAKRYSEDKISGKKGGDLGWVQTDTISKLFSDKVFAMKEGELSEPFETQFGFHVVTILEGSQVIKKPFESVKGKIQYQLRSEAKNAELDRLVNSIDIKISSEEG